MKFSARVSYALRAAIMLADKYGGGPVLGKEISEAETLPAAYLEQIMAALRRAEIVTGTRGAKGGYVLQRAPEQITVTELIEAVDGPIQLSDCPGGAACCASPEQCVLTGLFAEGEQALRSVFDGVSLAQLLERRTNLRAGSSMYHI